MSALAQTYPVHEVVVVDDASIDETPNVLARIAQNYPALRVVRHHIAEGGSASRNAGIRAATGDVIAFLDDDDEWLADKVRRQVELLESLDCGAVTCWSELDYGYTKRTFIVPEAESPEALLERNVFGSASLCMVRASIARDILFDERLPSAQDWDFWLRVSDRTRVRVVPAILVRYHAHRDPKITSDASRRYLGVRSVYLKYRHRRSDPARRRGLGMLAYLRSMRPGPRWARLRLLARAVSLTGRGCAPLVMSSLPRILVPQSCLEVLLNWYVQMRYRLAGLARSR